MENCRQRLFGFTLNCCLFSNRVLAISFLLALLLFCVPGGAGAQDKELHFTIVHTNDLHSHELPFMENGKSIGGLPRIANLMKDLRSKIPNTLAIDAGDIFEGTPFFNFYHGEVEVKMLNDAGYDVYTIGNHEFDDGPVSLTKQLSQAKFTVINCNTDTSAYPELSALVKPFIVKTIAGEKVAFIGAVCPDLAKVTTKVENVKVINADGDWMSPIREQILKVKQLGINKIVLVTHVGVDRDKLLAELPDVDVIIGGHSHTRLEKEIVVDHPDGSHCVIVQTGCYGRALGQLDLCFDSLGRVDLTQTHYHLIDITSDLSSDAKMTSYLNEKAKPFIEREHEELAVATARFDNVWQGHFSDSPLGDLVADALADGGAKYGATIALENRGGMRCAIAQGPITAATVEELLPFANTLTISTITGDDLRKVLEVSVGGSKERSVTLGAQFLDVHGLKFEWDSRLETLHRVGKIWALTGSGKYELVKPEEKYRVAINDYAFSTEGFDFTRATDFINTGKRLSVYLHDYLLKQKTVSPKEEGRIIPLATH